MNNLLQRHKSQRKLTTLVENHTIYNADSSELNIFETHKIAKRVNLRFDAPILASMLTGKKVMHLEGMPSFDFIPGESVVLPRNKEMIIDFPEATSKKPTQCLALAIDPAKISEVVSAFNESTIIDLKENGNWSLEDTSFHLDNSNEIQQLVGRLIYLFTEGNKSKDVFIDFTLKELIIRLLQTKARRALIENATDGSLSDNRIAFAINYMKEHLTDKISIDKLVEKSCLSKSYFFKVFRDTLGLSPIDYLNSERIKFSKELMKSGNYQVAEIAYKSGFSSPSYFSKQFKRIENITPGYYKKQLSKVERGKIYS